MIQPIREPLTIKVFMQNILAVLCDKRKLTHRTWLVKGGGGAQHGRQHEKNNNRHHWLHSLKVTGLTAFQFTGPTTNRNQAVTAVILQLAEHTTGMDSRYYAYCTGTGPL